MPAMTDELRDVEEAGGIITPMHVLVCGLPLEELDDNLAALAKSGYRPGRIRPVVTPDEMTYVAILLRDDRRFEIVQGPAAKVRARRDELVAALDIEQVDRLLTEGGVLSDEGVVAGVTRRVLARLAPDPDDGDRTHLFRPELGGGGELYVDQILSLIHKSEPTRQIRLGVAGVGV